MGRAYFWVDIYCPIDPVPLMFILSFKTFRHTRHAVRVPTADCVGEPVASSSRSGESVVAAEDENRPPVVELATLAVMVVLVAAWTELAVMAALVVLVNRRR